MTSRVRDFAERTIHKLRPRWTSGAFYSPNKDRKDPFNQKGAAPVHPVEPGVPSTGPDIPIVDLDLSTTSAARESPLVPEDVSERPCKQEEDPEGLPEAAIFTEGPSRIILANDGTKECLALLLSHDIVAKVNQTRTLDHKVETLQCQFDDADDHAVYAQIFLNQSEELIANIDNVDEQDRIRKDTEGALERLQKSSKKRDRIKDHLDIHKHNGAFSRNEWQEMFEGVLLQAGLLDAITEESIMGRGSSISLAQSAEQPSKAGSDVSNETVISLEKLNRMAAYEKVQVTEAWLHTVQDKFDTRRATYQNELREYRQAVEDGTCLLSQSTFDRIDLFNVRHQTFALIDAEAAYEHAKSQARALGIYGNDLDQESDFVDDVEDGGYLESLEAELLASVDQEFIEAWRLEIGGDEDGETLQGQDSDEWDAKTVNISDSISLVDRGRNRRRIDRWRDICGL